MPELRAGAAQTVITPALGWPMAGYIRRDGPAEAVLDDLHCRVLVLDDGVTRLAFVALDLIYASDALTARIRARAARLAGLAADHVMVTATHTHCGPSSLAGTWDPQLLDAIAERAEQALVAAAAALRPARLLLGSAEVPAVACNRRDPDAACDHTTRVVAAVGAEGRETIATLVEFACHPTILEHDTRAYSADFPGVACATVEQLVGGVAIFLQGCAADVNPAFIEHTARECRRVGTILGAAAARVVAELQALLVPARTINLSWDEELPVHPAVAGRTVAATQLRAATASIAAIPRPWPDADAVSGELDRLLALAEATADPSERRRLGPRIAELWALDLLASGPELLHDLDPFDVTGGIAVQGFQLGDGLLALALPGEPFAATGSELRRAAPGDLLVVGYANQSVGYLPPAAELARGGYEVGRAMYEAGTAERLTRAAKDIVNHLTTPAEHRR
jgi:neutral ceramidase